MVSDNWWFVAHPDLKKIWHDLLFKQEPLVVIFVQILKQKLDLVLILLLKANRNEALRSK